MCVERVCENGLKIERLMRHERRIKIEKQFVLFGSEFVTWVQYLQTIQSLKISYDTM